MTREDGEHLSALAALLVIPLFADRETTSG